MKAVADVEGPQPSRGRRCCKGVRIERKLGWHELPGGCCCCCSVAVIVGGVLIETESSEVVREGPERLIWRCGSEGEDGEELLRCVSERVV